MMSFNNHSRESNFFIHNILSSLTNCNNIKYAAYRTASKLIILQKCLKMDHISLNVVSRVFEMHQLKQTENAVQLYKKEVQGILSDIYFVIKNDKATETKPDGLHSLACEILFLIYDRYIKYTILLIELHKILHKQLTEFVALSGEIRDIAGQEKFNTISVISAKIFLSLICDAKPCEKYHYLFSQLMDHNYCISRKRLKILLKNLVEVINFIGEKLSFGCNLINGTIESCFSVNNGNLGVSEENFNAWLMQEPQLLVWFSTFHRLQISEKVIHEVKCETCKAFPIKGLRYRCIKCFHYNICQRCFFFEKVNKRHKLSHPVREYCSPITVQESTKAFLLTLRNILCKSESKLQYLPVLRINSNKSLNVNEGTKFLSLLDISAKSSNTETLSNKFTRTQLIEIMIHLEKEIERLIFQLVNFSSNIANIDDESNQLLLHKYLVKQKILAENQLRRLKLLKDDLLSSKNVESRALPASTPIVKHISESRVDCLNENIANVSPISCYNLCNNSGFKLMKRHLHWNNDDLLNIDNSPLEKPNGSNFLEKPFELPSEEKVNSISTWIGGKTLKDSVRENSQMELTWLNFDEVNNVCEDVLKKTDNQKIFEELQLKLKCILNEIQNLNLEDHLIEGNDVCSIEVLKDKEITNEVYEDLIETIRKRNCVTSTSVG